MRLLSIGTCVLAILFSSSFLPAQADQAVQPVMTLSKSHQVFERGPCCPTCGDLPVRSVQISHYLDYQIFPAVVQDPSSSSGYWHYLAKCRIKGSATFFYLNLNPAGARIVMNNMYICASQVEIDQLNEAFRSQQWEIEALYVFPDNSIRTIYSQPPNQPPAAPPLPPQALVPAAKGSFTPDPINIATGEMFIRATDFLITGRGPSLELTRTYRSQSTLNGLFGHGWRTVYDINLQETPEGSVVIYDGDGTGRYFLKNQDGSYAPSPGTVAVLGKSGSLFTLTEKDGEANVFENGRLTSMTDRNGNSMRFVHNPQTGGGSYAEDATGRRLTLTLDPNGRVVRVQDPLGRAVAYEYDARGDLVMITDPAGGITRYVYDADHNVIEMANVNGHKTFFAYDANDRAVMNWQENDVNKVSLAFQANNTTVVTDALGRQSRYVFNEFGLETAYADALNNTRLTEWDLNQSRIAVADSLGRTTRFVYDERHNLIQIVDALNQTTTMTYTPDFNDVETITDALGKTTVYSYDNRGNLIALTDPLGRTRQMSYNAFGDLVSVTDALNNVVAYTYDGFGQVAGVTDALGRELRVSRDAAGNILNVTDQRGRVTAFEYDALDRLTNTTYADGTRAQSVYDAFGNVLMSRDRKGRSTSFAYDPYERLSQTTDAAGGVIRYGYDAVGNVLAMADERNQTVSFQYDAADRRISETTVLNATVSFGYDAAGNVVARTDANGNVTTYLYDELNRLIRTGYEDGRSVTRLYDPVGRQLSMTDWRGTTLYVYDDLGRLLSVDGPGTNDTIAYSYDAVGNRVGMTDQDGRHCEYAYDKLYRLAAITGPAGVTQYTYDEVGNVLSTAYPNGGRMTATYDVMDRPVSIVNLLNATVISSFHYAYDAGGQIIRRLHKDGTYTEYAYDALDRLVTESAFVPGAVVRGVQKPPLMVYTSGYSYDAAGNRLSRMRKLPLGDYLREDATGTLPQVLNALPGAGRLFTLLTQGITLADNYSYDGENKLRNSTSTLGIAGREFPLEAEAYRYDGNGNRVGEAVSRFGKPAQDTVYTYDPENQLTGIQTANRYTNTTVTAGFEYDGDGLRRSMREGNATTQLLYDGSNVVLEKDAGGVTTAAYTWAPGYAGGIKGLISRRAVVPETTGSGRKRTTVRVQRDMYYFYDGLGSVVNIANNAGVITSSYKYDAFGNKLGETDSTGNRYEFSTKAWDDKGGLSYFGARYYDPAAGRWLTPDPLGYADGLNRYLYVGNDPVNYVDPWGLSKEKVAWFDLLEEGYYYGSGYGQSAAEWYIRQRLETGHSLWAIPGSIAALWTPETYQITGWTLTAGTALAGWASKTGPIVGYQGGEITLTTQSGNKFFRLNPSGDSDSTNPIGRLPHYHRRPIDRSAAPGEGIKHHRPWEGGW